MLDYRYSPHTVQFILKVHSVLSELYIIEKIRSTGTTVRILTYEFLEFRNQIQPILFKHIWKFK